MEQDTNSPVEPNNPSSVNNVPVLIETKRSTISAIVSYTNLKYEQQKHFAVVIFICSHALLINGLLLIGSGTIFRII